MIVRSISPILNAIEHPHRVPGKNNQCFDRVIHAARSSALSMLMRCP
jgi:hypothetical protein